MRTMVHMVLWSDKEIEARHGTRHVSSMWKGAGVYTSPEIVPEQLRKGHVFWEPVSWKGNAISDVWLRAIPYLQLSKEQSVIWFWKP